jgi:hypothetical protein
MRSDLFYFILISYMNSGEKIPGYTGYVPYRYENIGMTVGTSNKVAEGIYRDSLNKGKQSLSKSIDVNSRNYYVNMENRGGEKKLMVSNLSKKSKAWLQGPQHEVQN